MEGTGTSINQRFSSLSEEMEGTGTSLHQLFSSLSTGMEGTINQLFSPSPFQGEGWGEGKDYSFANTRRAASMVL